MFGPLEFSPQVKLSDSPLCSGEEVACILCDIKFALPSAKDVLLAHIFESHKVVIADVDQISDLTRYLKYWKEKFSEAPLTEYCSTIHADIKKDGVPLEGNEYFLLSDVHDDDKSIRLQLQNEYLEKALSQQKLERDDTSYSKGCLFCRQVITPTRHEYISHLSSQHNLQLGKPQNLVYIDELIEMVEKKMDNLECIYCEKIFKDRNVLKEHMRKKMHKRINPDNQAYDRFYLVNYKGSNKNWKTERKRKDSAEEEDEEPCDWSDWQETFSLSIVCLFCEEVFTSWEAVLAHMEGLHHFHYEEATRGLDFYQQVKLVNYIRRQLYKNLCINCDVKMEDRSSILEHMVSLGHLTLPPLESWNQPEFYFPTYENDAFLCQIDDGRQDNDELDSDLSDAFSEINTITTQDLHSS